MDEALAQYEETLEDIKNGLKLSKPADDGVTLASYPDNTETLDEIYDEVMLE